MRLPPTGTCTGRGIPSCFHIDRRWPFAKQYGFVFRCHEIGHCNRKAGEERSFWTVETNFFPGRTFITLEDLNQQALAWATVRLNNKPQGKAGLIPAKAFEHERAYLTQLLTVLQQTMNALEGECEANGKGSLFREAKKPAVR